MDREHIRRSLEVVFSETFLKSLMPGVIHNFANPLNTIMGRAKMLERRISDFVKILGETHPAAASDLNPLIRKISTDIGTLNENSDHFCCIFRDLAGKFNYLTRTERGMFDLTGLVRLEAGFANFFLDFKHSVKSTMDLDQDAPEVMGIPSDYSVFITAMIKYALNKMDGAEEKEIILKTGHDDLRVFLSMKFKGNKMSEKTNQGPTTMSAGEMARTCEADEQALFLALSLLKENGSTYEMVEDGNWSEITLSIPYV